MIPETLDILDDKTRLLTFRNALAQLAGFLPQKLEFDVEYGCGLSLNCLYDADVASLRS